ncbi:MAG: hypothetical protein M3176_09055 [Chloroflexota bacterium]|nr:hypothetical protein [Chloroflexota bacterium]
MAGNDDKAALQAHIAALETRIQATGEGAAGKTRNYVVKTQVFDECIDDLTGPGEPTPSAPGGESVHARLDRIESQLQRIIAKLES